MKSKNAVMDGITVLVILVLFGIISVIGLNLFTTLNDEVQSDSTFTPEAQAISSSLFDKYPVLMDNLFLFAFVLLIIFTIVSVFLLESHPIFFIITVVLLVGFFLSAVLLGNVFDDMMNDSDMSTYANQMPKMSWIMQHILPLSIVNGFILVIALFMKFRG